MRVMLAVVTLAILGAGVAFAWNPELCNANDFENRGRFEEQMRKAQPGDPLNIPKPFPHNSGEVKEDFLQQVRLLPNSGTSPLTASGQHALRQAIDQGTLHIGVVNEANWRNFRCAMHKSGETVYLLRLFDTSNGVEIGRATLEESGLLNGVLYPVDRSAPIWAKSLPTLAEGESILRSVVGKTADIQYVTSYGTVGCDEFMPCVGARLTAVGGYALMSFNGIYTFSASSRRVDQSPSADKGELARALKSLAPNEGMTTVGSTYNVIATKVAERP